MNVTTPVTTSLIRQCIQVQGIVQGVGFRPFVFGLAARLELAGSFRYDGSGVMIEAEGSPAALTTFLETLSTQAPPLARVDAVKFEAVSQCRETSFTIIKSQSTPRILVAGIGNIFHGDDIFGVKVAHRLMKGRLPDGVEVRDFGIRSYDLAYAILDDYDATILVDATCQGGAPGTLYLIQPDWDNLEQVSESLVDGHSMNPVTVLQLVRLFDGRPRRLYVVGCEPATLVESEDGRMELSEPLQTAVPGAIEMIESLIDQIREEWKTGG